MSRTVTLGYNAWGQVTTIDGPRTDVNDVTTLTYYECTTGGACGQLRSITNALGHTTTFDAYDAAGRLTRMTDPNGLITTYAYDPRGRLRFVNQGGRVTEYRYDAAGDLTFVAFPDGRTLTYTYDAARLLRAVTDNLGNQIRYGYDLKGNRTQEYTYDAAGTLVRQVDLAYDRRNRVSQINAAGSLTRLIYDAVGNLTKLIDPNESASGGSRGTTHQYDALSRLLKTVDKLAGATQYAYDVHDRLSEVKTPNGATTAYLYDDLGNLLQETSPDRGTTQYAYDPAGHLIQMTDARGVTVRYTYDALNRLTFVDYPGAEEDIRYTYDGCGAGRLCAVQDAAGTTHYTYDPFGNLIEQRRTELGVTYLTRYAYDSGDRVTAIAYPDGRQVSYARNPLGQITAVTATVNGTSAVLASGLSYRADGLLTGLTYGNGLSEVRQYDRQGRLTYQSLGTADTRLYAYDANGNLTRKQSLPEVAAYTSTTPSTGSPRPRATPRGAEPSATTPTATA